MASTFFGPDDHWQGFAESWKPNQDDGIKPEVAEATTSLDGRREYRTLPGTVDQPDDDGFLVFPNGIRWHVSDWDAGKVDEFGMPAGGLS